ncbi:MAG: hypothetical protein N2559_05545 [Anaerolineae bacterium]|nr:hypothetical protein [Anaerolineae bacterium]
MSRLPIQTIALFLIIVAAFFLWDFSQRILINLQLWQLEKTYEQQVREEEMRNTELRQLRDYVATDEFVNDYARRNWRWALPNDTVVIPQITPVPTPTPRPTTPTPIPTKTLQQQLFDFFFGP